MNTFVSFNISIDPKDKDSIYLPDLIGAQLGIEKAKNNIKQFLKRQEEKTKKIEDNIPNILKTINMFFGEKQ